MNKALWHKAFSDIWVQLLISSLILIGFSWIFLWLISMFKADLAVALLRAMPGFIQRMIGIPIAELATPAGADQLDFRSRSDFAGLHRLGSGTRIGHNRRRNRPGNLGYFGSAAGMEAHFNSGSRSRDDYWGCRVGCFYNDWNRLRTENRCLPGKSVSWTIHARIDKSVLDDFLPDGHYHLGVFDHPRSLANDCHNGGHLYDFVDHRGRRPIVACRRMAALLHFFKRLSAARIDPPSRELALDASALRCCVAGDRFALLFGRCRDLFAPGHSSLKIRRIADI